MTHTLKINIDFLLTHKNPKAFFSFRKHYSFVFLTQKATGQILSVRATASLPVQRGTWEIPATNCFRHRPSDSAKPQRPDRPAFFGRFCWAPAAACWAAPAWSCLSVRRWAFRRTPGTRSSEVVATWQPQAVVRRPECRCCPEVNRTAELLSARSKELHSFAAKRIQILYW